MGKCQTTKPTAGSYKVVWIPVGVSSNGSKGVKTGQAMGFVRRGKVVPYDAEKDGATKPGENEFLLELTDYDPKGNKQPVGDRERYVAKLSWIVDAVPQEEQPHGPMMLIGGTVGFIAQNGNSWKPLGIQPRRTQVPKPFLAPIREAAAPAGPEKKKKKKKKQAKPTQVAMPVTTAPKKRAKKGRAKQPKAKSRTQAQELTLSSLVASLAGDLQQSSSESESESELEQEQDQASFASESKGQRKRKSMSFGSPTVTPTADYEFKMT